MSAEMFSALVVSRLRPVPEVEVQGGKGLQLHLSVRGHETTAQLERAYERYRANPEALSPVIDELIQSLLSGKLGQAPGNEEFARIAPQLFPRLLTSRQWMDRREDGLRLIVRPFVQDLGVTLVIDRRTEIEYVQIESIPEWGVDPQAAYDTALANLERRSKDVETRVSGAGVETLLVDSYADGYAAARVLLSSRLTDWQARVQGELVLGMPTADLLLGFARNHPAF